MIFRITVAWGDGLGNDTLGSALNNVKNNNTGGCITIPLLFYFNNNPGLAIPLISLQYHEVRFIMHLASTLRVNTAGGVLTTGIVQQLVNSIGTTANVISSVAAMKFYVDYAYLRYYRTP